MSGCGSMNELHVKAGSIAHCSMLPVWLEPTSELSAVWFWGMAGTTRVGTESCCDLEFPNNGFWMRLAITLHTLPVIARVPQILSLLQDCCNYFFLLRLWNKFSWQELPADWYSGFSMGLAFPVNTRFRVQDWVTCDRKTSTEHIFRSRFYA